MGRRADKAAKEVNAGMFGAVMVPGGFAPDSLRCDQAILALVADTYHAGKLVGLICHA